MERTSAFATIESAFSTSFVHTQFLCCENRQIEPICFAKEAPRYSSHYSVAVSCCSSAKRKSHDVSALSSFAGARGANFLLAAFFLFGFFLHSNIWTFSSPPHLFFCMYCSTELILANFWRQGASGSTEGFLRANWHGTLCIRVFRYDISILEVKRNNKSNGTTTGPACLVGVWVRGRIDCGLLLWRLPCCSLLLYDCGLGRD